METYCSSTFQILCIRALLVAGALSATAAATKPNSIEAVPFADDGKIKMFYDSRQRPQSVLLHDHLYIVYNGNATPSKNGNGSAFPMLTVYDPEGRSFTEPTRLGPSSTDHHDSPVIWADEENHLHLLYGCHKSPGAHLVSKGPVRPGQTQIEWTESGEIASMLSYPTVSRIYDNQELVYYRTEGHNSSWTYRVSADNGKSWQGPKVDITDLDRLGFPEWSSYQAKLASRDGKFLHVVYTDYDDVKSNDPKRLFNPRYGQPVGNNWKYNLSYLKIDLESQAALNADGVELHLPIDLEQSRTYCQIWDTAWRGAGVPPAISLDEAGEPTFLHVLSEGDLMTHRYYYVRREKGQWVQTPICNSNHQWNSGYLSRDEDGDLHAYVIVGNYLEGGYMDKHGGGRIEDWVSSGNGYHWEKHRDLTPDSKRYPNWRFNNVQPALHPDGSAVEGMLFFYGWGDPDAPQATAFLLHE